MTTETNVKLLIAGVLAAVWTMVWGQFLLGPLVGPFLSDVPATNPDPAMLWVVVGNLVGGLILAAVYARTRSVFGVGAWPGAVYGVYAGVLINFPLWLFVAVYVSGWPYHASWAMTLAEIVKTTVAGALIGMVYRSSPKAA